MKSLFFILTLVTQLHMNGQRSDSTTLTCGMFGTSCGITGSPETSIKKTVSYVNTNDKGKLLKWLNSDSAQDNIHGFVGLYFMKRNGIKLTKEEEAKMKELRQSESIINYCRGCAFGLRAKLKDLLTYKNLNHYYQWYLLSGMKNYIEK